MNPETRKEDGGWYVLYNWDYQTEDWVGPFTTEDAALTWYYRSTV